MAIIIITHVLFLLLAVGTVCESRDAAESTVASSTRIASSHTVEEQSAGSTGSVGDSEDADSVPRGTVFLIVSTPAEGADGGLGVVGALFHVNRRSTDTLLDHYRRVKLNKAQRGRQSCPTTESVWTVRPKDSLTVHTDAKGRVVCTEGESYAIGKVKRVTSGTETVQVVVAKGTLIDQDGTDGQRTDATEISLVPSKNLLGKTKNGGHSLRRPPQMKRGESVALICPRAGAPVIALQTDYASLPEDGFSANNAAVHTLAAWPTRLDETRDSSRDSSRDTDLDAARVVVQPLARSQELSPSHRLLLTLQMRNGKAPQEHKSFFLDAGARCQLSTMPLQGGMQPLINMQCFGARRRRRKRTSMTAMPTVNIPRHVRKNLDRALEFLSYFTIIGSSAVLAGHGLLAFDATGREAVLNRMLGPHYVAGKYNVLQFFISPEQVGNYFRAGTVQNLKILAQQVGRRQHVQAALGYIISGIGVRVVNLMFPLFLLFVLAYVLNRPVLWPVQKIYEYFKHKSDAASAAAATRSTIEVTSLCPPKRVIVKCVGFQEQLQMME